MADFQSLNNLTQLGKVPIDMTIEGHNAFLRGQNADQIGLQELMRKQAHEQQMDPMRVAHQQLVNKGLTLGNEKSDYELKSLGRKDKMETELWDQTKASKLAKLLDEEGEAKANTFGQQLYQKLQTTRPGTPEHRAIMGALETTKGWVEKKRDQRYEMEKVGTQAKNARELMQMQIDAGRFKGKGGGSVSFEQTLSKFKKAHEQHQALVQAELMARQEGNDALADSYKARADAIRPQAEQELKMIPAPGAVDVGAATGMATTPQGSIAPKGKPGSSSDNPIVLR